MNEYAMEAENVTVQYVKGKRVKALTEFSLKLHKEQLIGLIGANGSGKTTFFKVCSGAIAATTGKISVLEEKVNFNLAMQEELAFCNPELPIKGNLPVRKVLELYAGMYPHFDVAFANKLLDLFGVSGKKRIQELSLGNRAITYFIFTLATRAKVTLLDEPFNGIDFEKRKLAYEVLLRDYIENPRTILISSHNLAELKPILSEMVLIHEGKVIFYEEMDTIREMLFRADGEKEQAEAFLNREEIITVNSGELGTYFIGRGSVNGEFAKEVKKAGMKISAVEPEDVCVYLTSKRKESELECLWK